MHRGPAYVGGHRVDHPARVRVCLRQDREPFAEGLEVQHGAAHEQGHTAGGDDVVDALPGVLRKARGGVRLRRVEDVDEVMRHPQAHGGIGLGGADVHVPVDERRVETDDLHRPAARETHGHARLAAGGGAQQRHDRQAHRPRRNRRSRSAMENWNHVGRP